MRKSDEISSYQSAYKKWTLCEKCHDNIHNSENDVTLENTMIIRRKTTDGYMLKENKEDEASWCEYINTLYVYNIKLRYILYKC